MVFCWRKYEEVRETPELPAGTLVFFSGRWTPSATAIKLANFARHLRWSNGITHIGIVVKREKQLYILESGRTYHNDGLVDHLTGHVKNSGVRLVLLHERLQSTRLSVYFRDPLEGQTAIHSANGFEFAKKHKGKAYEKSLLTLLNSAFHFRSENPEMDTVFCSELVADYLCDLAIIQRDNYLYSPAELSQRPLTGYGPLRAWTTVRSEA